MAENERLARLEVQMQELLGADGRPGRVPKVEEDVKSISRFLWIGMGGLWLLQILLANGWLTFFKRG